MRLKETKNNVSSSRIQSKLLKGNPYTNIKYQRGKSNY